MSIGPSPQPPLRISQTYSSLRLLEPFPSVSMSQEEGGEHSEQPTDTVVLSDEVRELASLLASHDHDHGLPPKSRRKINWDWIKERASPQLLELMRKKSHLHCFQRNPIIAMVPSLKYRAFRQLRDSLFSQMQTKHGLTVEQVELAHLLEEIKARNPSSNRVFDWVYIHRKASLKLMKYINEKRKNVTFDRDAMRHLVGDSRRKAFAEFRLELRESITTDNLSETSESSQDKKPRSVAATSQPDGSPSSSDSEKPNHKLLATAAAGKVLPPKFPPVFAVRSARPLPRILSAELMELAELLEDIKGAGRGKVFDWDYIDSNATPKLRAFIDEKRGLSTFHRNTLRCLVPQSKLDAFAAYRAQIRHSRAATKAPIQQNKKRQASDDTAASKPKKRLVASISVVSTEDLAESGSELGDNEEEEATRRSSVVSSDLPSESSVGIKRPSRKRIPLSLSEDLKELGILWELSALSSRDGITPDWDEVQSRASPRLSAMIEGKLEYEGFMEDPARLLVPSGARRDFDVLRARVRLNPQEFEKDVGVVKAASSSAKAKNAKNEGEEQEEEEEDAPVSSLHLTPVQKELANLFVLAREQRKTWDFIEARASVSLRQYIQKKSRSSSYLETPLRCLIPRRLTVAFHSYCADIVRSTGGTVFSSLETTGRKSSNSDDTEEEDE